ncbi:DUF4625 domain-containing protein [Flavobacterium sp. I3-2]|uniref:DUF4625 domain-containing protein n=1 Tax=Flavobacterium sp. I3-2 TaxID=2748319 RepID=UPI0015A7B012|nr:DUF4625 domain-containing protein [Flavobacterium sp. I3-2]
MKNILYTFLLVTSALFLGSCSSDGDSDAPTIEIVNPLENQVFETGDPIKMKFRLTDEYGIAAYAYQIYHEEPGIVGEFTYEKEIALNTLYTSLESDHSVNIPLMSTDSIPTAVGNYNLRVIAVDIYNNRRIVDRPIKIIQKVTNE